MEIQIIETKEIKSLTLIDANGIDWSQDYMGNNGAEYGCDEETGNRTMSAADFAWWSDHLSQMQAAEDAKAEAISEHGWDAVIEAEEAEGVGMGDIDDNPSRMMAAYESLTANSPEGSKEEKDYIWD